MVSKSDKLRVVYTHDAAGRLWTHAKGLDSYTVHPDTQLSGCFAWDGNMVIFSQNEAGQMQGVSINRLGDADECPVPPSIIPEIHSPAVHTAFTSNDNIPHSLFIVGGDVCYFALEMGAKRWQRE